ncbi:SusC/RagA family TonB-linked outer membrane protein [Arachidicoccus ginsenosidivorans]|jgi:iron complex outermembrane receptor protein
MKKQFDLLFKTALLVILILFVQSSMYAQNGTISGVVSDSSGAPLPGVTVGAKQSNTHDITNNDGSFSLKAQVGEILTFSYIGYTPQEVAAAAGVMKIVLVPSHATVAAGDVVVTAYGIKKENKNLGYAVTTVAGDDITRTNSINPIAALQGKVAGLQINVMNSAGVQTSPYIQLRGAKVVGGNNQPIFVVDGNILQNNISGPDAADQGSQLLNLNPDDYASITVLKGAAATAIYGSRGLNGAIVITTKSGKSGKGIGVEYSSTYQTTVAYAPFMELQNEYGQGFYYREGAFYPDGTQDRTVTNWGPKFDGTLHPAPWNPDTLVPYIAKPDNWKTFYNNGRYVNNNITLSGGSEKANYRISYSNTEDKGVLPNNKLKRNAVDMKFSGEMNKVFSVDMGVNYANTKVYNVWNQSRYFWTGGQNLGFNVYYVPRNTDFEQWHNTYRNPDNSTKPQPFTIGSGQGNAIVGGFSAMDKNNRVNTQNSLLAYLQLNAKVTPWLDLSAKGNINYYNQQFEEKDYGNGKDNSGGYYGTGGSYTTNYDVLFMAHATKKVNDFNFDLRLLNEYYGNLKGETYGAHTNGGLKVPNQFFLGNSVQDLGTTSSINYGISYPSLGTVSIAGDFNINYKDYLNLEITGRNDWLSTLTYPVNVPGMNNYSIFYPSFNLSYAFSDHLRSKLPEWLTFGKLRASLAYVGNDGVAGAYSTGAGYGPGVLVNINGQSVPTASILNGNVKPNYDLRPQKQRSIELGTNLAFFKNLFDIDFAWYKTNTFNQLLHLPGVPETGYNTLYINAGNIQNTGYELLLNVNPIRSKDWGLTMSVNIGHNAGKVVNFYHSNSGDITDWTIAGNYEGVETHAYEGGAFGVLVSRGSNFLLDPKTGFPIIKNNGRVTDTSAAHRMDFQDYAYEYKSDGPDTLGKIEPKLTGGFSFNLRYKNFSLFAQMDGRWGGYIYSESWTYAMGNGTPLASLQYRDQAHGGSLRTDVYGNQVYNGAVPDAVFAAGEKGNTPTGQNVDIGGMTFKEAYNKGYVASWYAPAYYDGGNSAGTYDWENGINWNGAIAEESWLMLREITLGYNVPAKILRKTHVFQDAKISFSARNIGYLYNSLPGKQNPGSIQSNDPFNPWITGGAPFTRTFAVRLDLKF